MYTVSDLVIMAMIAAVPPTLMALAAVITSLHTQRKLQDVHNQINGRMEQLIEEVGSTSRAEGRAEGIEAERVRPADIPKG